MPKTSKPASAAVVPTSQLSFSSQLPSAFIEAFKTNHRINEYLINAIAPEAWNAKPPDGKGRTIAAIVAHMHNVRLMWLKVSAKGSEIPNQLDRATVTPAQAVQALQQSADAISALLHRAFNSDGRVKNFRPDAAGFFAYLIAHDAHHRGQIAMLARQLDHALPQKINFGMWEWGSR
jgi:uncharacterized damage-inducible protein DinB